MNHRRYEVFCHRLLWETWIDKIPFGLEINHIDGNKKNNNLHENLEVISRRENYLHSYYNDLRPVSKNGKIKEEDVKEIRKMRFAEKKL